MSRKTLPLPKQTMKVLFELYCSSSTDFALSGFLKNILNTLADYEYLDAVRILGYLEQDYPDLIDYKKAVKAILSAKRRYEAI